MDFSPFVRALLPHWWALMSCAVFTILGVVVLAFNKSNRWALWATFGTGIAMLFLACFLAWRDQYRENEIGRTVGSLALERVEFFGAMPSPSARKADVQLTLVLKNIQPRLMECRVNKIDAQIQNKGPADDYVNKGGYVYGGREIALPLPFIRETDIVPIVVGEVEYSISYNLVGSAVQHTTSKKLAIRSYPGQKTDYSVVTEDEK